MEVEPKDEMKERVKKSPDLYDWFAIAVEGARRLGFRIQRIGGDINSKSPNKNWLNEKQNKLQQLMKAKRLKAA